jgi:hypothetical protein
LVFGRWPNLDAMGLGQRPTTNDQRPTANDAFAVFTYPDFPYAFMLIGRLRDL